MLDTHSLSSLTRCGEDFPSITKNKYSPLLPNSPTRATFAGLIILLTICILLFGRTLIDLFTDTPELIDLSTNMMRVMAVGYIAVSITQVLGGVMRGAGDTVTPMWVSIISTIILRVPTAYLIAHLTAGETWPKGSPYALSGSLLISWTLGMVIQVITYKQGKWKKKMYAANY